MEIVVESRFTKDEFVEALANINKKSSMIILICSIIIYASAILLTILNLITKSNDYLFVITSYVVATIFLLLSFVFKSKKLMEKSILKNNKSFENGVYYRYQFNDDSFTVDFSLNQASGNQVIYYKHLYKQFVIKNNLYIYINRVNTFIVKLDGLGDDEKNQIFNKFPKKVKGI